MSSKRPPGQFFPYKIDPKWSPLLTGLGVRSRDGVTLTNDGHLFASFGRWVVKTPLENVDHTEVSGSHRWYTAVGLRLSSVDTGLTFGTNSRRGICIGFVERIPKVVGPKDHAALWVSVADPDGLAEALRALSG